MKVFNQVIFVLLLGIWTQSSFARDYSAGEIQSKITTQYGRYEFSMYSSDKSGTTSTFFMWKDGSTEANVRWNELDVETFGKSADSWQSNPIWEYSSTDQNTKRWEEVHYGTKIAKTWVKFSLEWTPNYIAWYVNGAQVRRINKGDNVPASHFRYNNGDSDDPVTYIADPMKFCFNHWSAYSVSWLGEFFPAQLPSYQFVDWFTYQKWNGTGFDGVSIRNDFNSMADVTNNFNISTHTFDDNRCQFATNAVGVTSGYLWLGIFNIGQERSPNASELPTNAVVNKAPTVSLTAPTNLTYTAPASVAIAANAADTDGTIAKVEFYSGATLIGTDATAPYTFTWANVAVGSYSITAKATDNSGAATTSAAVNITVNGITHSLPKKVEAEEYYAMFGVQLETTGDVLGGGQNVGYIDAGDWMDYSVIVPTSGVYTIEYRVSSALATGKFSLMSGANALSTVTVPNTANWQTYVTLSTSVNLTAGPQVLRIAATGSGFNINYLNFVQANVIPTVSLTAPLGNATYTSPATIAIAANAADADGSVSKVEFYNGAVLLGSDLTAPYTFSWANVATGTYTITAKATDNSGAATTSAAVSVVVKAPNATPTVSVVAPATLATYSTLSSIDLSANAADSDGSIAKVEFYNGTLLLATDITAPYLFTWTNVGAGSYAITAKATDNVGAVTTSAVANVAVTVLSHTLPKKVEAENFAAMNGIQLETTGDVLGGGQNIGYVDAGDWMDYSIIVPTTGAYTVDFRVASLLATGKFNLTSGATTLATVTVPNTGNWQTYVTLTATVNLTAGPQTLRIAATGAGFNVNWMNFAVNAPTVNFANVANNAQYAAGSLNYVNVTATYSSAIANVVLYIDGILVRQENIAPYEWYDAALANLAAGTHELKAVATSSSGAVGQAVITITIASAARTVNLGAQPFSNETTISYDDNQQIISVLVFDNIGRIILSKDNINSNSYTFGQGLSNGMYNVHITSDQGTTISKIYKQ